MCTDLYIAPALLAGNSVHADKTFINKDLPLLASKLHYRILDVSSIKEIGRRWYPSFGWESKKDEAEHRWVCEMFFFCHPHPALTAPLVKGASLPAVRNSYSGGVTDIMIVLAP